MRVVPLTYKEANTVIARFHRHNRPVVGARFCLGAEHEGKIVGVATVGRPVARMLATPGVAEVTRLCTTDDAPKNTCSFLYAAARRTWQTMGGTKLITYTLQTESGASLRAAGWIQAATTKPAQWGRKGRPRKDQDVCNQAKFRWESMPDEPSTEGRA
jgi:hypothetical protein